MKFPNLQVAVVVCLIFAVAAPAQEVTKPSAVAPVTASDARQAQSETIIPRLIKFSGTLLDAHEHPVAGPVGVTFALYSQQMGGAALWLETQNVKADEIGNYTVLLGANSANGLPSELFVSGEARWLGIQVGQQPEHERILLVSVPYALKAGDAETLGGKPLSSFMLNEASATGSSAGSAGVAGSSSAAGRTQTTTGADAKTSARPQAVTPCSSVTSNGAAAVNSIALFTMACNVESSVITQSSGNVGIGTATPAVAVDVAGNNAGLRLSGTGTHQVTVSGATSGRLGQDANGFFFASDTKGSNVRFLTNNGTLNEWMRITSAGNVGIGTTAPAAKVDVTANNATEVVNLTQTSAGGNGLVATVVGGFGVNATATAPGAVGVAGNSSATTSSGVGVIGSASSPGGTGVLGTSAGGIGVKGVSSNATGIAGEFSSTNGATILQGLNGGTTEFSVSSGGAVFANGSVVSNGAISANGGFSGSGLSLGGIATLGGPLGVGTTIPKAQLDVHDFVSGALVDTLIGNPGCGTGFAGIGFLAGGTGFGACTNYSLLGDGASTYINAGPFGSIRFRNVNADAMVVDNTGKVGIGTTSPHAKLDVNGTANISGTLTTGNLALQVSTTTATQSLCAAPTAGVTPGPNSSCSVLSTPFTLPTGLSAPVFIIANLNGVFITECSDVSLLLVLDGTTAGVSTLQGDTGSTAGLKLSATITALPSLSPGNHSVSVQLFDDFSGCPSGMFVAFADVSANNSSSTIILREW